MAGDSFKSFSRGIDIFIDRSRMNENIKRSEVLNYAKEKEAEETRGRVTAEHGHEPASVEPDPRKVIAEKLECPQYQTACILTQADQSHEELIHHLFPLHCSSRFRKQPYLKSITIEQKQPEFGRKTVFFSEIHSHPEVS